jgi:hypothetical protein
MVGLAGCCQKAMGCDRVGLWAFRFGFSNGQINSNIRDGRIECGAGFRAKTR